MNHSTDQNKKDYGRLIEALTPKHAPVTRMKFVMPRHRRNRLARLLHHVGRVAAVLVIGVGIGLLLTDVWATRPWDPTSPISPT